MTILSFLGKSSVITAITSISFYTVYKCYKVCKHTYRKRFNCCPDILTAVSKNHMNCFLYYSSENDIPFIPFHEQKEYFKQLSKLVEKDKKYVLNKYKEKLNPTKECIDLLCNQQSEYLDEDCTEIKKELIREQQKELWIETNVSYHEFCLSPLQDYFPIVSYFLQKDSSLLNSIDTICELWFNMSEQLTQNHQQQIDPEHNNVNINLTINTGNIEANIDANIDDQQIQQFSFIEKIKGCLHLVKKIFSFGFNCLLNFKQSLSYLSFIYKANIFINAFYGSSECLYRCKSNEMLHLICERYPYIKSIRTSSLQLLKESLLCHYFQDSTNQNNHFDKNEINSMLNELNDIDININKYIVNNPQEYILDLECFKDIQLTLECKKQLIEWSKTNKVKINNWITTPYNSTVERNQSILQQSFEEHNPLLLSIVESNYNIDTLIENEEFLLLNNEIAQSIQIETKDEFQRIIMKHFLNYFDPIESNKDSNCFKRWFCRNEYTILYKQYKQQQIKFANIMSKHTPLCFDTAGLIYNYL